MAQLVTSRGGPRGVSSSLFTSASETNFVFVPNGWRSNRDARPIIFCHGSTATAVAAGTANFLGRVAERTGMVLACPSLTGSPGGLSAWANDSSITKLTDQWTALKASHNVKQDKMVLYGQSMGAVTALIYALTNPNNVAAIYLEIPAINVDDIHDNDRLSQAATINTAYTDAAGWEAAKATKDPYLRLEDINELDIPIFGYYGEDDPFCLPEFAVDFDEAVDSATLVELAGVAHDAATVPADGRAGFLTTYKG